MRACVAAAYASSLAARPAVPGVASFFAMSIDPAASRSLGAYAVVHTVSRTVVPRVVLDFTLALACAACVAPHGGATSASSASAPSPAESVRELQAADRAFAAASARTDLVTGVSRMFAADVLLPAPNGEIVRGAEAGRALLEGTPDNARSRLEWTPIRAGVSADGVHGFTYGYQTLTKADGTTAPGKYVAYWTREGERPHGAWKVSVYRRVPRPPGDVSLAGMAPVLPPRGVAPDDDPARRARLAEELAEVERAFSRDARGGPAIGDAFARYGDPSAANAGGRSVSFVFGPRAIGDNVQRGLTAGTHIEWAPVETRVASSGDLGVTIGFIAVRPADKDGKASPVARLPYFTIWRRDDVRLPWRYVAE